MRVASLIVALGVLVAQPVAAQGWKEYENRVDRFTVPAPGEPKVDTITWDSEYGAKFPGRVYKWEQGRTRYSVTVIDYSDAERIHSSNKGSYVSQATGSPLHACADTHVQSNGNIALSGSAMVYGDAIPGPGKTVSGANGVTGSTAPATSPVVADACVYAPPIGPMGSVASSITLCAGKHRYTSFVIGAGKIATITGDVELWVDGKFEIAGSGMLERGARLTIHHGTDKFTIGGSGFVNQDQKPANLTVDSATTHAVALSGGEAFFGTLRAPKAPFSASGGPGIYGSVVAKTLTLNGGTSLHYDKALRAGRGAYQRRLTWPSDAATRKQ